MNADVRDPDEHHRVGDSATRPIRPRCGALAALLLLAGMSPQRRRALPAHRIAARSGAFNCGFQVNSFALCMPLMSFVRHRLHLPVDCRANSGFP